MSDIQTKLDAEDVSAQGRRPWTTPVVRRMNAGDAENGSGPGSDDQINFS